MLRIRQGSQERYVWPVHLPGWLVLGWRLAGAEATAGAPTIGVAAVEPPAPIAADGSQLLEPDDAKPASTRGRRGRRSKEEPELPPAGGEAHPEETGTTAEVDAAEHPAAPEAPAEADTTPGDDSNTEGAAALGALPDDLFSDPLI
jgi:hypothetical protein